MSRGTETGIRTQTSCADSLTKNAQVEILTKLCILAGVRALEAVWNQVSRHDVVDVDQVLHVDASVHAARAAGV